MTAQEVATLGREIEMADQKLRILSRDEKLRILYEMRFKAEKDQLVQLGDARHEGIQEGLEKGREEGLISPAELR